MSKKTKMNRETTRQKIVSRKIVRKKTNRRTILAKYKTTKEIERSHEGGLENKLLLTTSIPFATQQSHSADSAIYSKSYSNKHQQAQQTRCGSRDATLTDSANMDTRILVSRPYQLGRSGSLSKIHEWYRHSVTHGKRIPIRDPNNSDQYVRHPYSSSSSSYSHRYPSYPLMVRLQPAGSPKGTGSCSFSAASYSWVEPSCASTQIASLQQPHSLVCLSASSSLRSGRSSSKNYFRRSPTQRAPCRSHVHGTSHWHCRSAS